MKISPDFRQPLILNNLSELKFLFSTSAQSGENHIYRHSPFQGNNSKPCCPFRGDVHAGWGVLRLNVGLFPIIFVLGICKHLRPLVWGSLGFLLRPLHRPCRSVTWCSFQGQSCSTLLFRSPTMFCKMHQHNSLKKMVITPKSRQTQPTDLRSVNSELIKGQLCNVPTSTVLFHGRPSMMKTDNSVELSVSPNLLLLLAASNEKLCYLVTCLSLMPETHRNM